MAPLPNKNERMMIALIGRVHSDIKAPMLQTGESDPDPAVRLGRVKRYHDQTIINNEGVS